MATVKTTTVCTLVVCLSVSVAVDGLLARRIFRTLRLTCGNTNLAKARRLTMLRGRLSAPCVRLRVRHARRAGASRAQFRSAGLGLWLERPLKRHSKG